MTIISISAGKREKLAVIYNRVFGKWRYIFSIHGSYGNATLK